MFTKIFKSDYIIQLFFFIAISILIWIKPFLSADISYLPTNAPLYDIIKWFIEDGPFIKIIISFSLLLTQSLILKNILSSNELAPKTSLLSAFLYFLMMSTVGNFQSIQPLLFGNFFLILALQVILTTYSKPESYEQIFNSTLLISLGSMFYLPIIFFVVFIWFVFLIFGLFKWREWIISILGLITPYVFLFSYYFFTNTLNDKLNTYLLFFKNNTFNSQHFTYSNLVLFGIFGFFLVISAIFSLLNVAGKTIFYRKKNIVLIMFSLIAILSLYYAKDYLVYHLCLLFIPFSYFFANYVMQIKRIIISETIFLILFAAWLYTYLGF